MIGPEQLAAGHRAENAGDFVAAVAAYRAVIDVPDEHLAAQAQFCLGRVTWRQGRFDASLAAFENARALAERIGDHELHARVANGVGAVHYAKGDYPAARRAYAEAQARTLDRAMRGKILLNLGVIENIEGNYLGALSFYESAYALFDESKDNGSAMLAVHNRGMVEADLERWDDADASFLAALALATCGMGVTPWSPVKKRSVRSLPTFSSSQRKKPSRVASRRTIPSAISLESGPNAWP